MIVDRDELRTALGEITFFKEYLLSPSKDDKATRDSDEDESSDPPKESQSDTEK